MEWYKGGHTRACLIIGPCGVGKSCLASAFLSDRGLIPWDCRSKGGDFSRVVEGLIHRKTPPGMPKMGLIIDEIHNLDGDARKVLGRILATTFPVGAPPVICIVDACVLPKQYSSIKKVCQVVTMYKPFANQNQDAGTLLHRLKTTENFQLSSGQTEMLVEQSCGDLRALTTLAELASKTPLQQRSSNHDLFMSPFEAARDLLKMPKKHTFEKASELIHMDALMPLFVHENAARLQGSIDSISDLAESLSMASILDDHWSHQLHNTARDVETAAVCAQYRPANFQARVQFPSYLGETSTRNANKRHVTSLRNAYGATMGHSAFCQDILPVLAAEAHALNPRTKAYRDWLAEKNFDKDDGKFLRDRYTKFK